MKKEIDFNLISIKYKMTTSTSKLQCAYVCLTKYDAFMFRVLDYTEGDKMLEGKLKDYEGEKWIYINKNKARRKNFQEFNNKTKYQVKILLCSFNDKKTGDEVVYIKDCLIKPNGEVEFTPEEKENLLEDSDTEE